MIEGKAKTIYNLMTPFFQDSKLSSSKKGQLIFCETENDIFSAK